MGISNFDGLAFVSGLYVGPAGSEVEVINSLGVFVGSISAIFDSIAPTTTRGDIIYRDASTNTRLAVGSSSTVLVTNGLDPSWSKITNANIDAAAAIAGTKISPNFGSQNVVTTGAERLGTTAVISDATEKLSVLRTYSGTTSDDHVGGWFLTQLTTNSNLTGSHLGLTGRIERVLTASATDTGSVTTVDSRIHATLSNSAVWTRTTSLISNFRVQPPVISGVGTLAWDAYTKLSIGADSIATGTRKIGLGFGALTGATHNAAITDNETFTGNYFIHSTSTNASFISGNLSTTARLWVDTSAEITGTLSTKTNTDYVILDNDRFRTILVSTGNTTRAITLPSAANNTNRRICIKKTDTGTGFVTVTGTIDGHTNLVLHLQNEALNVVSNGTAWFVEGYQPSEWTTWSPTYAAGGSMTYTSVTTQYAQWRKVAPKTVEWLLSATGTTGGSASTSLTATTPINPVDNSGGTTTAQFGTGVMVADANNIAGFVVANSTSGLLQFFKYDLSNFGLNTGRIIRGNGRYKIA